MQSSEALQNQQIAAYAAQLASSQEQWGQNQYAATSAVTNNSIDNYLAASQQDMNLANQTTNQYENTTVPEINQQANEAAQYASAGRIGVNMGAAESQSMQGTNAAMQAAKQNLQSYGINPSSGEYAELNSANRTAAGAAAAGAGQQSELATEATGRGLLASSIATGQQLPGQAINASNAGTAAITGAQNAALANANTGVALTDTGPSSLLAQGKAALPGVGNASTSTSQSTNQNTSIPTVANQSGSMGTAGGTNTGGTSPTNPTTTGGGGGYGGGGGGGGGSGGGYYDNAPPIQVGGGGYGGSSASGYATGGDVGNRPGAFSFGGDATQGGHVSQQASPSGGINVDDVPANLNSEEFVVPRDVARWKGEEFFHKMIDQSRKARVTAAQSVGPTAGPAQSPGQQPTFDSQSAQQPQARRGGSIQRFAAGGATSTDAMGSWGSSLNQSGLSGVAGGGYNPPSASPTASSATTTPAPTSQAPYSSPTPTTPAPTSQAPYSSRGYGNPSPGSVPMGGGTPANYGTPPAPGDQWQPFGVNGGGWIPPGQQIQDFMYRGGRV
jgi:hypothetical protein